MTFKGNNDLAFEAIQVSASTMATIAQRFSDYTIHNGNLIDSKGAVVPIGTWITAFEDGTVRMFSDSLFEKLFVKVEPPVYTLSEIPDFSRGIRRKSWVDIVLRLVEGTAWILYENGKAMYPYTFTTEDITAKDWLLAD